MILPISESIFKCSPGANPSITEPVWVCFLLFIEHMFFVVCFVFSSFLYHMDVEDPGCREWKQKEDNSGGLNW